MEANTEKKKYIEDSIDKANANFMNELAESLDLFCELYDRIQPLLSNEKDKELAESIKTKLVCLPFIHVTLKTIELTRFQLAFEMINNVQDTPGPKA